MEEAGRRRHVLPPVAALPLPPFPSHGREGSGPGSLRLKLRRRRIKLRRMSVKLRPRQVLLPVPVRNKGGRERES